jgi:hypothetical protein
VTTTLPEGGEERFLLELTPGQRADVVDLLMTISGFSELLLNDGPGSPEWVERVEFINDAARALTRLLFGSGAGAL